MNDNVKYERALVALAVSLSLFLLLSAFCLPTLIKRDNFYSLSAVAPNGVTQRTENGVSYVGQGMTVISFTEKTSKGSVACVKAAAPDDTVIDISAYYASGKSSSSVFEPKTVADGATVWEWRVPKSTTADSIRIVLRTETCYATFRIDLE